MLRVGLIVIWDPGGPSALSFGHSVYVWGTSRVGFGRKCTLYGEFWTAFGTFDLDRFGGLGCSGHVWTASLYVTGSSTDLGLARAVSRKSDFQSAERKSGFERIRRLLLGVGGLELVVGCCQIASRVAVDGQRWWIGLGHSSGLGHGFGSGALCAEARGVIEHFLHWYSMAGWQWHRLQ